jgi:peptidoglycan/LPS O-acetylase OafA/YrhL
MLGKISGPGAFRFFLALMVFVHHTTRFFVGTSAVYIFFCLSGYWIYTMYVERYSVTRKPYLTFAVSRMWRLLPVFWLVVSLTMLFLYRNGSLISYWNESNPAHFILSNLFILGYDTQPGLPLGPAWSLDIEVQFYLIAPLIAVFLSWRKVRPYWILLGAAALSLSAFLLNSPVKIAEYIVYFMIGMTAASLNWRPSGRAALASFAGTAILVVFVVAAPWRGVLLVGTHPGPLAIYNSYANVAIAILMVPYAIYTTGQTSLGTDGMLADLSYIIYLLHWVGAVWITWHPGGIRTKIVYTSAAWILVLGLSLVIWKFYDRPINRMRSRWVSRRKRVAVKDAETAILP